MINIFLVCYSCINSRFKTESKVKLLVVGSAVEGKNIYLGFNLILLSSINHGEFSVTNNDKEKFFYIFKTCGYANTDTKVGER